MTQQEAEILYKAMEKMVTDLIITDDTRFQCRIMEEYSGKGMYEEKTYAVVIDSMTALLQAIMTFPELLYDNDNGEPISIGKPISKFSIDQLGHSIILY